MATKDPKPAAKQWITAADLLAGATLPMKLTLNVTLHRGLREEHAAEDADCLHRQSPAVETRFEQYAPHVAQWAAKSRQNAEMLLVNPMAAIAESRAKVSRSDALLLKKHLRTVMPSEVLPPGVELVASTVKFADDDEPRRTR